MGAVADRLAAEKASEGLTVEDLGGIDAVAAEAGELAGSTLAPMLAYALAAQVEQSEVPRDVIESAIRAFIVGLAAQTSTLALADTLDVLVGVPKILSMAGDQLRDVLMGHVEHRTDTPGCAAAALQAAVRMVLSGATTRTAFCTH